MEKGAWQFNMFVSGKENSRRDEWKLTLCHKVIDQAVVHQHLKTCSRYIICDNYRVVVTVAIARLQLCLGRLHCTRYFQFSENVCTLRIGTMRRTGHDCRGANVVEIRNVNTVLLNWKIVVFKSL